jgi:hypothetical protein
MEEHGAGHIGDVEFTSSTFYKYFSCSYDSLAKNLSDDKRYYVSKTERKGKLIV